jgi:hypothetical protein
MAIPDSWTVCRYGSGDEALHDPSGQPLYNESVYVNFVTGLHDDGLLGGILRVGLRPTDGYRELSLNLPLDDGSTVFLYEREALAPDEFQVGSPLWHCAGMRLEATEPTRRWMLAYEGTRPRRLLDPAQFGLDPGAALRGSEQCRVSLHLAFEGQFPLHALSASGDILAEGGAPFARDHYEQFGSVSGTIELGGRVATVAGAGLRDHSWGPRDWQSTPHSNFTTIIAQDGTALVAFAARLADREQMHGLRWTESGMQTVNGFELTSDYTGEVWIGPSHAMAFDLPDRRLRYDGTVRAFLPLRHRSGEHTVRIGQTLLDFSGPAGAGRGWSDFTRPA